jgi:hypothetical protein
LQAVHGNAAVARMVLASPQLRLSRSPFTVKGTQADTVNYLPSELTDLLARLMRAGDLDAIKSLEDALVEDAKHPPDVSGLSPEDVELILTMVRSARSKFEHHEYAPTDLPLDPNVYGPTVDREPPGLFLLYRTMSANGVQRIVNAVASLRGPGLGNKRRDGTPVGENFYATSLEAPSRCDSLSTRMSSRSCCGTPSTPERTRAPPASPTRSTSRRPGRTSAGPC